MHFSSDRENELILENYPKIYRAVDNYMARCPHQVACVSYDDMVQVVSIAFLGYIRRVESEDALKTFPWFDALHAMSEFVLSSQPLSVPKSTKQFSKIIHSIPGTVSFDVMVSDGVDVDGMSKRWVEDEETRIDFDAFMETQPEYVRRLASMCFYGMSRKQIAAEFGVSRQTVYDWINKLFASYQKFMEER